MSKIQIVILQRGWVVVGEYSQEGEEGKLEKASVIRKWGTTKGLGEIAMGGVTPDTVLDKCPTIRFHRLTSIFRMDVDDEKWAEVIK